MLFLWLFFSSPCQQSECHLVCGKDSLCSVAILVQGRWATGQHSKGRARAAAGCSSHSQGKTLQKHSRKPVPLAACTETLLAKARMARALADVNSAALCVPKLFLLSGPLPASPCLSFPMRGGRPVTPHLPICSFLIPLPGTFPHYTLKQHLVKIHWGGICSLNCWSELTWWIFV